MSDAQKPPVSAGATQDASAGTQDRAALLARFHEELRRRNAGALLWSTTVFDLAYLAWTFFDRLLAPAHADTFLAVRITVAAFGTGIALWFRRPALQRYAWEAFWVWLFVCGTGIAFMLPFVDGSLPAYALGYSLILYGPAALPHWKPSWALSNIVAIMAMAPVAFLLFPGTTSTAELVTSIFFVLTGAIASGLMAVFKYRLARRDFLVRSELAETSDRLGEALSRLEAQDRIKSRFFANLSHELRTPLTLILSPVQAILALPADGDGIGAGVRRDLRTVAQNAARLLRLIDDLLELSRLDAGGLRLKLSCFDLGELVAQVVERSRPAAEGAQLRLELEQSPDLPDVWGDPHRLEIVISNLVGNALKYTPPGGKIVARVATDAAGLRVEVEDDGPGIPERELALVFERFFQAEGAERAQAGGVGIGLALAKELIDLHDGEMDVRSTEGEGSTFAFTLPLGREHFRPEVIDRRRDVADRRTTARPGQHAGRRATDLAPPVLPVAAEVDAASDVEDPTGLRLEQGRRPRVLVAEDQGELRAFIGELLAEEFEVIDVADGDAAWEAVRSRQPDLVLTDVMMPGRPGTALCRDIKSDPDLHGIPVILLTARASTEDTLRAYAVGADDFVAKPFHPRVLLARVRAQLRLRAISAQLAQRERLAAVGTLAAGILHEVRNPVNALRSAAGTLARGDLDAEVQGRLLQVIDDASGRIHDLTATLDAHIRPADDGGDGGGIADLREGLDATLRLLDHRLGDVEVTRDYADTPPVLAPAGPLNQVLLNLVDNALKAGATRITLAVAASDDTVELRVVDDGEGIPSDALPRLFEPFFTTAPAGKGSGLGLYLSRQIVEQAGGTVTAVNTADGGACFTVRLRRAAS